jgi:hypothetical protein
LRYHLQSMARVAEVWAVVQRRGETWTGRMICARGLDEPRVAFPRGAAPATLPLGSQVDLGLATRKMPKAARCGALLIAVDWTPDAVELTFDPDDPELFQQAIPGLMADPTERRADPRLPAITDQGITVAVRFLDDLVAPPLIARLCDASPGGLGLQFPYSAEDRLCATRVLVCELAGPDGHRRDHICEVTNRTLLGDGVRYGVEFVGARPR